MPTTLLKFRRLLEHNGLTQRVFDVTNAHLAKQGLMLREGAMVAAPPSTKNQDRPRDALDQ